jgi:hypothetical protein
MTALNLVTPKAAAEQDLLFDKLAFEVNVTISHYAPSNIHGQS